MTKTVLVSVFTVGVFLSIESCGQTISGSVVNLQSKLRVGVDVSITVRNRLNQDALDETALSASGKKLYDKATAQFFIPIDTRALLRNDKRVNVIFEGPNLQLTSIDKLSGLSTHNLAVIVPDAEYHICCCCKCSRIPHYASTPWNEPNGLTNTKPSVGDTVIVVSNSAPLQLPGKTLANIPQKTTFKVRNTHGDWIWATVISNGNKSSGWISSKHVGVIPEPLKAGDNVEVMSRTANLKIGSKVVAVVHESQVLDVTRTLGDWVGTIALQSNGEKTSGWIQRKYVGRVSSQSDVASK